MCRNRGMISQVLKLDTLCMLGHIIPRPDDILVHIIPTTLSIQLVQKRRSFPICAFNHTIWLCGTHQPRRTCGASHRHPHTATALPQAAATWVNTRYANGLTWRSLHAQCRDLPCTTVPCQWGAAGHGDRKRESGDETYGWALSGGAVC
jgi:hypothetical protein